MAGYNGTNSRVQAVRAPGQQPGVDGRLVTDPIHAMPTMPANARWRVRLQSMALILATAGALAIAGCRGPSQANIDLRKEIQSLQKQVADLQRQHEADQATIASLQSDHPTTRRLEESEIQKLYTVHGFSLGKLTGTVESAPGDNYSAIGYVYLTPTDQQADQLKAAGAVDVKVFDLSLDGKEIGSISMNASEAKEQWVGAGLLYCYRIPVKLYFLPKNPTIALRVSFTDALTGRKFTQEKIVSVRMIENPLMPSSATQPTSIPAKP